MYYFDFHDKKLSALGLGMMRLPILDGDDTRIDEQKLAGLTDAAIAGGVNYFDTAWGYHGGQSELAAGRVLSAYPRESFYLASKFPGYDNSNMGKVREIFAKQLEKCGVEYFDFYLFHNVCESNIDDYLDPANGILSYLLQMKAEGRIRHLGFSAHGKIETITRFLDAYGEHMEFGQLQINWVDWSFQNAREKAELLASRSIPVWVMEPLRGGKLAAAESAVPGISPIEQAFRFIQGLPQVGVTLSGMSDEKQLSENLRIFGEKQPLSAEQSRALAALADRMISEKSVPCTACRYCTEYCPQGLDIPELLRLYNEHVFSNGGFIAPMHLRAVPENKRPSACIGCKSCEQVCPQGIKISEAMRDFAQKLK